MKKILLTTTALTLVAGAAAADMSLSGNARLGVDNAGTIGHRTRFIVTGSGESDGGVSFGATVRYAVSDNSGAATIDNQSVNISSNGFTLRQGAGSGAMKSHARAATWFGYNSGSSADNNIGMGNSTTNTTYLAFAAGSANISASTDGTDSELGASFSMGAATVGLGTSSTGTWMAAVNFDAGSASIGVGTNSAGTNVLTVSYPVGATTINFGYTSLAGKMGVGVTHDFGGGLSLKFGADNAGFANVGVLMSF